jgi:hypothetical protein
LKLSRKTLFVAGFSFEFTFFRQKIRFIPPASLDVFS